MTSPKGISASELIGTLERQLLAWVPSDQREAARKDVAAARKALQEHCDELQRQVEMWHSDYLEIHEERKRLRSRLAAAERDTQRLDWLERPENFLSLFLSNGPYETTLREKIDKAGSPESPKMESPPKLVSEELSSDSKRVNR